MTSEQHAKAIEDAALRAAIRAGVDAAPAPPDVVAELEEVKTVCAQAYQVMGVLLSEAGRLDSPEAKKILDNLAEQRLRHTDVLPWAAQSERVGWQLVPVEPTPQMLSAVVTSMDEFLIGDGAEQQYIDDWAAMLAAAPKPTDSAPL